MTTTDTDALTERIAEELYYDQHPEGRHRSEWPAAVYPDAAYEYRDLAAAVLPIIAAEVQTAKAEALREAAFHAADISKDGTGGNDWFPEVWAGQVAGYLKARAAKHETGDRA